MEKIAVKELIEFRRKHSDSSKRNFAQKLKTRLPKVKSNDDKDKGGDYWKSSSSCICKVAKEENYEFYDIRIAELISKQAIDKTNQTKSMRRRNIDVLISFKDFNIYDIRPRKILDFETVQKADKIIHVDNLPLYLNPDIVFSHERDGKNELGAVWLVPIVHGYTKEELGVFCEILYRFLTKHFSDNYQISNDFCIAIDTFSTQRVSYQEIINGDVSLSANKTLAEIKNLM